MLLFALTAGTFVKEEFFWKQTHYNFIVGKEALPWLVCLKS